MANKSINNFSIIAVVLILSYAIPSSYADPIDPNAAPSDWKESNGGLKDNLFPEVEITLSNDGVSSLWYMCQIDERSNSLYELPPNSTYRFKFPHVAFPMRWCYLYINHRSHGFFWVYTVRSRCTKCFWSINKHPSLYRNDKGRWERQKLFMPPTFNITNYLSTGGTTTPVFQSPPK